jgi:hypothetical protein
MVGAPKSGDKASEHLLDGQQRLTALWRSLHDDYDDRRFFVSLEEDTEVSGPYTVTSIPRYVKKGKSYPLWMNEAYRIWEKRLIPVSLFRPDPTGEKDMNDWAKLAAGSDAEERIRLLNHINGLRNKFSNFNIPFLSLPAATPSDVALDVFIKMNTSSFPLSPYDIIVAQAEASSGRSLHDLLRALQSEVPELQKYADIEDTVLSIAALVNNQAPVRKTFLSRGFPQSVINNWPIIKRGIEHAIQLLTEEKVFDHKRLPSDLVLYVLGAVWANAPTQVDKTGNLRAASRKYMWHAFLTERYEKTGSTRALMDARQLREYSSGKLKSDGIEIFDKKINPLPTREDLLTAGWPAKRERLARAMMLLSFQTGALDFADGSPISAKNCDVREHHHVFPVGYLGDKFSSGEINRALNCALISMPTNRTISDKEPKLYLSERIEGSDVGEREVTRRLESHLLPVESFMAGDYERFIGARADLMHSEMVKLVEGLG